MRNDIPSPTEMHLLALVISELTGREVAKKFKEVTGGSISYGTLYTTFRRLNERGWVDVRDAEDEDGRLRYFTLTGPGQKALSAGCDFYRDLAELKSRRWAPAKMATAHPQFNGRSA